MATSTTAPAEPAAEPAARARAAPAGPASGAGGAPPAAPPLPAAPPAAGGTGTAAPLPSAAAASPFPHRLLGKNGRDRGAGPGPAAPSRPGLRLGRRLLDLLLPPRCLACEAVVDEPGALCPACFGRFGFITEPFCRRCGLPFAHAGEASREGLCSGCLAHPPAFDRARAVWRYDAASRPVVTTFKHADRTEAAPHLARHLARAGGALLAETDLLAPVPLHRWRLLGRRYNQAALLALALGRLARKPVVPDLLRRLRATPSQGHLGLAERARNVAGAFALRPRHLGRIAGRRVLLVDDVLTSGATASACAAVLKEAGAAAVNVLVLARVPHPSDRLG